MIWGIWWIFIKSLKSLKIFFQWALFVQSMQGLNCRNTEEFFHDTEEWCKIWINFDVVVSKSAWGNELTFIGALKNLENCTLMGFLCPKHIIFQLENFIGVMFHDTEGWAKFKVKLTPGLKNVIRNLVNFHASSRKSENFNFNRLLLSKTYKVLDEKVQKNYISWH